MPIYPTLTTERLRLKAFTLDDAPEVQRLAGEKEIAAVTLNIPHPYEDGLAEEWIGTHQEQFEAGQQINFAIVLREANRLIGSIGLMHINRTHDTAEIGYWIGKPFWGNGYCTEAVQATIAYALQELGLNRVYAMHFSSNPASGRVMQKVGMRYEGCLRQHIKKWGTYEDSEFYGILKDDFENRANDSVDAPVS